ncbi:TetR/AcrR family transcriptional regulator [Microbacterium sp. RD1]|uniref:TetR/AcrR family transcriptional regulator n=1 Tax=Microbacterium sp. RD1 TaxID=3457313 RepID=UPI003FA55A32
MDEAATVPRRTRPKDRKQQILIHARDLIVEHGYPNITLADVAERVGITAGAIYRHFADKATLLDEVFTYNLSHLDAPLPPENDPDVLMDAAFERVGDHSYVAELWRWDRRYLPPESQQALRDKLNAWVQTFVDLVRRKRPELDDGQAKLIGWAMQSVLTAPNDAREALGREQLLRALKDMAGGLLAAELEPSGGPAVVVEPQVTVASIRERLLLAAIDQFGADGYDATSMSAIGAAVGVTGPNLYSHFESKAELFTFAFRRGVHAAWLKLGEVYAEASDPVDALHRMTRVHAALPKLWIQTRLPPLGGDDVLTVGRRAQADYVREWVHLLLLARPDLAKPVAYLRVLTAFAIADDLSRTPTVNGYERYEANLAAALFALLTA